MHCVKEHLDEVRVCVKQQQLFYKKETFPVSTSRFGLGTEEGSFRTPLGLFQVVEKYGSGEELYTSFKGRKKVRVWSPEIDDAQEDAILTRILRLTGMSLDNSNTFLRYIYIHGTNNESALKTPASMGCIRMKNSDIIQFYNTVPIGTSVSIELDY